MWTPEYFVRYLDLPPKVNGVTVPNDDGTFDIYINARHSAEHQADILAHELWHIMQDHFYTGRSVSDCERDAKAAADAHRSAQERDRQCSGIIPPIDTGTRTCGGTARI